MQSCMAFFIQAPLVAISYHWVTGVFFMHFFAVLLSGCRSLMRPGAMWFINNPQDQNSNLIRNIIDRPALAQLRKVFVSGIVYSSVVACVVGSVAGLVMVWDKLIMPFRWKNREPLSNVPVDLLFLHLVLPEPLSNVPVDLLFLHLVLPYTMHYFEPKQTIKQVAMMVWKYLAARLRLTSYFFGHRHQEEEYTPKDWRDNFRRDGIVRPGVQDGTFCRVPATDHLALPRGIRATVAVNADGEPVDDAALCLMNLQNAEVEKVQQTITSNYMVVYMPPYFCYRIILFFTLLWIFGTICLGFALALLIHMGRSFFWFFTLQEVHDGYSIIVGFYLIWICHLITKAINHLNKRCQQRGGEGLRAELPVLVLKWGLLWLVRTAYIVFFLGAVIPVLLAIAVDLYIVLPIRFMIDPGHLPKIKFVDAWALGLLYVEIGMHAHWVWPPNRILRHLQHIEDHGWTHLNSATVTKEVIIPLIVGLLGMILPPGLVYRLVQYLFPSIAIDDRSMFMHVYPTVLFCTFIFHASISAHGLMSLWLQSIKNKEFLVEMRLKDYDPDRPNSDTVEGLKPSKD
ncbi:hypothetical protein CVT26_014350 [Gymnopilus dilepis]|uniref:RING-type E3 ubiquitin transferase n=1 Tax=Gymnopilus dilepis TaxID=231916 RepID=A0A409Y770_9AGAR|nr:hypothetical protein CVT26_014350 [Gymnopilus dilepis]